MSAIKESLVDSVSLRCDCLCTAVVVDKFKYSPDKPAEYNVSFQNSLMKWGFPWVFRSNSARKRVKE